MLLKSYKTSLFPQCNNVNLRNENPADSNTENNYFSEGSLLSYLRKNAPVNSDLKLRFATEASAGLAYLESKHCIHRFVVDF